MLKIIYLPLLWISICNLMETIAAAQEYLPPKVGGGGKKATPEPTLPASYDFSYKVEDNDVSLDFGHNEKRKDDRVQGSYHVLLPDGRMLLVEYEAGSDGYKPQVMYMGTATYPATNDKFDGYHYNAASNRQSVRQAAPRGGVRQTTTPPAAVSPTADRPHNNVDRPHNVVDRPHNAVDRTHNVVDRPHNAVDRTHNVVDRPHNNVDRPHNVISPNSTQFKSNESSNVLQSSAKA